MISLLTAAVLGLVQRPVPDAPKGLDLKLVALPMKSEAVHHSLPNYRLTFVNRTNQLITLHSAGFSPNHKVIVTNAGGDLMPRTQEGQRALDWVEGHIGLGGRNHDRPIVLKPGERWSEDARIDVAALYNLKPGLYNLTVEYYERGGYPMPYPLRVVSSRLIYEKRPSLPR